MGINAKSIPDVNLRSRAWDAFISALGFSTHIGLFTYDRPGSLSKWHVAFRMPCNHNEKNPEFIAVVQAATSSAPTLLSRRQTKEAVQTISCATGTSTRKSKIILDALLPDGTFPTFCNSLKEQKFVSQISRFVLCSDGDEELELVDDMRRLNVHGNQDGSKFDKFWEYACRVVETD